MLYRASKPFVGLGRVYVQTRTSAANLEPADELNTYNQPTPSLTPSQGLEFPADSPRTLDNHVSSSLLCSLHQFVT